MTITPKDIARFQASYIPEPNTGCFLWTGNEGLGGYGAFHYGNKNHYAHRVAWEIANGDIPKGDGYHGMCVLHRCDTRPCVNPDHLFLGTQRQNIKDRDSKGRCRAGAWEKAKTHCPNGHEYTPENTSVWRNKRKCRKCHSARESARWHRKRQEA